MSTYSQARLWACGCGDVSTPSFGSQLNHISNSGGRLCPPYTGVHTKFWKPQASKVRWRFRKILCPAQNIWTLPEIFWGNFNLIVEVNCFYSQNSTHGGCNLTEEFFRKIWAVFLRQLTLTNSGYYAFVKLLKKFRQTKVMFLRTGFVVSCKDQEEVTEAMEVITWLQSFWGKFEQYSDQNSWGNWHCLILCGLVS